MRLALAPALLLLTALLSGCASSSQTSDSGSASSLTCRNGDCEVCVDGTCAPCEAAECDDCRDGDCPALDEARDEAAQPAQPLPDVDMQEVIPLTQGLATRTWTFDSAAGATGHVRFTLRDAATKEAVAFGSVCFAHDIKTWDGSSWSHSQSRRNCGNGGAGVGGGSTTSSVIVLGDWDVTRAGHYEIEASANNPQPNELVVDVVIDNP